ncbi:MAG: YciI family protein [Pseudomonadota bacterium]|nr:YciI family protein [Pseudomonadota bacterium]
MAYLLIVVEPTRQREARTQQAGRQAYEEMLAYAEDLKARGVLQAVESLATPATRVEVRDGRVSMLDGPFAEAKEMIGGIFLLDVASREQALAIAAQCPAAAWCSVEVRETGPCWQ